MKPRTWQGRTADFPSRTTTLSTVSGEEFLLFFFLFIHDHDSRSRWWSSTVSGGDGFQDDDDVDVDGSYHDNDGEDDHNDDHDDDHDGELVKIEISGSGWRDPDEVVWPAAMHIENTHMHSYYCLSGIFEWNLSSQRHEGHWNSESPTRKISFHQVILKRLVQS